MSKENERLRTEISQRDNKHINDIKFLQDKYDKLEKYNTGSCSNVRFKLKMTEDQLSAAAKDYNSLYDKNKELKQKYMELNMRFLATQK